MSNCPLTSDAARCPPPFTTLRTCEQVSLFYHIGLSHLMIRKYVRAFLARSLAYGDDAWMERIG